MNAKTELLKEVHVALKPWNYEFIAHENTTLNHIDFVGCIMTQRRWTTRYICAVVTLPKQVNVPQEFLAFAENVRQTMSNQYAQFPYWKEIGLYLVVICSAEQYSQLAHEEGQFKDKTGLHKSVLLGTVFIDVENKETTGEKTWGLYNSGKHYQTIKTAAEKWCSQKFQPSTSNDK